LLQSKLPEHWRWAQIPRIAARLALEDDNNQEDYAHYVEMLCSRAACELRHLQFSIVISEKICALDDDPEAAYHCNLLAAAAYTNKCAIIEELADEPPDLESPHGLFGHPHVCAAVGGNDAALDLLCDKFKADEFSMVPLMCRQGAPTRIVARFIPQRPATPIIGIDTSTSSTQWVPDDLVLYTANLETFQMLMRAYPSKTRDKIFLKYVLIHATMDGKEDCVRNAFDLGAPLHGPPWPDCKCIRSEAWVRPNADCFAVATRALARACEHGWEPIVRLLLEHGAELKDDAFAVAAKRGHMNLVKVLVELGADPNKGEPRPIVSAISLEREDMFYGLLELGATLDGELGQEALKKARDEGLTSMLALLGKHGVDVRECAEIDCAQPQMSREINV
jgi:hypothetical protein